MIPRRQKWARTILVIVLLGVASMGVPAIRKLVLAEAGWALVVNEPVESADVIVVAMNAHGAGALEAADLVHKGIAARVAVFAHSDDPIAEAEFSRRGIPYETADAASARKLRSLGIDSIVRIPRSVSGTEDEGPILSDWCEQQRFRSIVIVSTSDHSRRLRRVLRRSMHGHQITVRVHCSPYSEFDPDRWWYTRGGIRTEIEELEKLLFDVVRHPFS